MNYGSVNQLVISYLFVVPKRVHIDFQIKYLSLQKSWPFLIQEKNVGIWIVVSFVLSLLENYSTS
jgi:hypothetical protein